MTIEQLRARGLIILECISGSKAYGLDTATSDTDLKGVFILPKKEYYGLHYIPQVNNETNDIVFYELGRFMELLSVNNPNILELLNTPSHAIVYKHPFLEEIKADFILSKCCKTTFGNFALSQIKKAKGYDAKNMMHVFRLLEMAAEIGYEHKINVLRPNRAFLLDIKAGKYDYDTLLEMAETRQHDMENAFAQSSLPKEPNLKHINELTFLLREKFYEEMDGF